MANRYHYRVAKLNIRSEGEYANLAELVAGFRPFEIDEATAGDDIAMLFRGDQEIDIEDYNIREVDLFDFPDADADCHFCRYEQGFLFYMVRRSDGCRTIFVGDDSSPLVISDIASYGKPDSSLLRFGLWIMFGIILTRNNGVAIHSSVIEAEERAVMFLGESGTGKSTHTRLWRENIEGAHLLNDDSPIVRIDDEGNAIVYGTPWSGKTPCYRNLHYPLAGIVRLSQAPHNKIRPLHVISAIGALLPSCPPSFAYDATLQDRVCNIISQIIRTTKVYHLECLPDGAAAELSHKTIFG